MIDSKMTKVLNQISRRSKYYLSFQESSRVLKKALKDKKQMKQQQNPEESKDGILQTLRGKIFNVDNLLKVSTYRFLLDKNTHPWAYRGVNKMFEEYEIPSFDFETRISSVYRLSKQQGQRLAVVDGVPFLLSKTNGDLIEDGSTSIYVPIWMRDKAKKIISREMLKHRPSKRIGSSDDSRLGWKSYSDALATQEQFIRDEEYQYIDKVFKRMVENKQWYIDNGKAYKETFLLHGKPGTGKTNTYMHFGAKYGLNIMRVTPEQLVRRFENITKQALDDDRKPLFILIEDIDACEELILKEYKSKLIGGGMARLREESEMEFTYSTFINALNGAEALHNIIVGMSTNHKEKLIASIYRAGRVDHQLDVKPLDSVEIASYINTEFKEYIAAKPNYTFSIANIIDLRACKTKKEIDDLAKWIHDEGFIEYKFEPLPQRNNNCVEHDDPVPATEEE